MHILLEKVSKNLGGRTILDSLDFEISQGETYCIIGRSGTGKSVTLKHLVGLLKPDSGKILIDGTDTVGFKDRQLAGLRKRMGYLFQSGALLNWMTVSENVALPLLEHERRLSRTEVFGRVREKLALVGLEDAEHKMPENLSGGMKKRAGLARAIIRDPELVLYDEPTSGLDPVMSSQIDEVIRDLQKELGVTSIVVTHDMASAYRVADRIGMLYEGRIIAEGTPDEIRSTTNPFVRQFIHGETKGPLTTGNGTDQTSGSEETSRVRGS